MEPDDFNKTIEAILDKQCDVPWHKSVLVGVSGIDGSGKGYLTKLLVEQLLLHNVSAIGLGVDGWLNLPHIRFNQKNPAMHFYEHAIRFDEMFQQLVLPLRQNRKHCLVANYTEETATEYRKHTYQFEDVDVIVLEGIYLFKQAYQEYFDLKIWVDCSFETALERALQRGQEGLPPAETIRAYNSIYFPAQRIHFAEANPQAAADLVIINDDRISSTERARPMSQAAALLF